jgi:hypothetical protein
MGKVYCFVGSLLWLLTAIGRPGTNIGTQHTHISKCEVPKSVKVSEMLDEFKDSVQIICLQKTE